MSYPPVIWSLNANFKRKYQLVTTNAVPFWKSFLVFSQTPLYNSVWWEFWQRIDWSLDPQSISNRLMIFRVCIWKQWYSSQVSCAWQCFVFAFTNVHQTLWMRWNEQLGQSHNPGCNNTRIIIKQRYIPLFVVPILRLTKVNGFHLYKVNLICLLMYWGFLHFYNTKLLDNCFLILHHISSSSCSSLWKFLFQLWFFCLSPWLSAEAPQQWVACPPFFLKLFQLALSTLVFTCTTFASQYFFLIFFVSHCSSDSHLSCVLLQLFDYNCI